MNKPELSDELWTLIEPLIPVKPRRFKHPGRKPRDARNCVAGILFVLFTGIPWEYLPREFGCCGMTCWRRNIEPIISEHAGVHGSGLGVTRWVVERTLSWLHQFRRLRIRYDRTAAIHQAFLTLGSILICWRHLADSFC